jgi:hypothetical protein
MPGRMSDLGAVSGSLPNLRFGRVKEGPGSCLYQSSPLKGRGKMRRHHGDGFVSPALSGVALSLQPRDYLGSFVSLGKTESALLSPWNATL